MVLFTFLSSNLLQGGSFQNGPEKSQILPVKSIYFQNVFISFFSNLQTSKDFQGLEGILPYPCMYNTRRKYRTFTRGQFRVQSCFFICLSSFPMFIHMMMMRIRLNQARGPHLCLYFVPFILCHCHPGCLDVRTDWQPVARWQSRARGDKGNQHTQDQRSSASIKPPAPTLQEPPSKYTHTPWQALRAFQQSERV